MDADGHAVDNSRERECDFLPRSFNLCRLIRYEKAVSWFYRELGIKSMVSASLSISPPHVSIMCIDRGLEIEGLWGNDADDALQTCILPNNMLEDGASEFPPYRPIPTSFHPTTTPSRWKYLIDGACV